MNKIKTFFQSKYFIGTVKIVGVFFVLFFVFEIGMFFGFQKASFSFRAGENYFREMRGAPNDPMLGIRGGDFTNSHGSIGKIIKISLPNVLIEDRDNTEKNILINNNTVLKSDKGDIKPENLKEGQFVMVIGSPDNDSDIDAKLVRIMPTPAEIPNMSTSSNK